MLRKAELVNSRLINHVSFFLFVIAQNLGLSFRGFSVFYEYYIGIFKWEKLIFFKKF